MARKKQKKTYQYQCSISGKAFTTTAEAPNPKELLCVSAYYEMHPEEDDRPEQFKTKLELTEGPTIEEEKDSVDDGDELGFDEELIEEEDVDFEEIQRIHKEKKRILKKAYNSKLDEGNNKY